MKGAASSDIPRSAPVRTGASALAAVRATVVIPAAAERSSGSRPVKRIGTDLYASHCDQCDSCHSTTYKVFTEANHLTALDHAAGATRHASVPLVS